MASDKRRPPPLYVSHQLICTSVLLLLFSAAIHKYLAIGGPAPPRPFDAPGFSEARAAVHLHRLAALGLRNVGTVANEVEAPAVILSAVAAAEAEATRAGAKHFRIETDVQVCSGIFQAESQRKMNVLSYQDVKNVLVRVSWPGHEGKTNGHRLEGPRPAVLISAHYDSQVRAVGAADDLYAISTMLELLRALLLSGGGGGELGNGDGRSVPEDVDIIFNFNGAEEVFMNAAHCFITQHKWKDDVRAFVNLESTGAAGRELAFQMSDAWLTRLYGKTVPRPHACALAQEVFETGLVPGETDYRIYREFSNYTAAGIDTALTNNGFVYHTANDVIDRLQNGTLQHTGDNFLRFLPALAREVSTREENGMQMSDAHEDKLIFFDFLGLFVVMYDQSASIVIYAAILLATIVFFCVDTSNHLSNAVMAVIVQTVSSVAALVSASATAAFVSNIRTMMWFQNPVLAYGMYGSAALAGQLLVHELFCRVRGSVATLTRARSKWKGGTSAASQSSRKDEANESYANSAAIASFWGLVVQWLSLAILFIAFELRSAYLFISLVVCPMLVRLAVSVLRVESDEFVSLAMTLSFLPSIIIALPPTIGLFTMLAPIMGRSGTTKFVEVVCGLIVGWCAVVIGQPLVFLLYTVKGAANRFKVLSGARRLATIGAAASIILAWKSLPFTELNAKRIGLQHIERCVHSSPIERNCEEGIWLTEMDPLPINETIGFEGVAGNEKLLELFTAAPPGMQEDALYGDLPYMRRIRDKVGAGVFLPTPRSPPKFSFPAMVSVLEQTYVSEDRRRIRVRAQGGHSMQLIFNATNVLAWSLSESLPASDGILHISHACGEHENVNGACHLELTVDVSGSAVLQMSLTSHEYVHTSSVLRSYASQLPSWITPLEILSSLNRYNIFPE